MNKKPQVVLFLSPLQSPMLLRHGASFSDTESYQRRGSPSRFRDWKSQVTVVFGTEDSWRAQIATRNALCKLQLGLPIKLTPSRRLAGAESHDCVDWDTRRDSSLCEICVDYSSCHVPKRVILVCPHVLFHPLSAEARIQGLIKESCRVAGNKDGHETPVEISALVFSLIG